MAETFQNIWIQLSDFLLPLLASILILIIGWTVAAFIGGVVARFVASLKLDNALRPLGVEEALNRAGFRLDSGMFLGGLVKWYLIVVVLVAAIDILGLTQINLFLREIVLGYLPNVIIAAIILLLAAILADVSQKVIVGSAKAAHIPAAHLAGGIAKWAIWIFALLVALSQLGIAPAFAQTLFTGLVAMLALAGGLAFGLGGKDAAASYLERLRRDIAGK